VSASVLWVSFIVSVCFSQYVCLSLYVLYMPLAVEALVRSYAEVIEYCNINKSECARIISEETGWSEEEVLLTFDSVQMLTPEDNLEIMTNFENPQSLYNSGKFISEALYELEQINELPDYDKTVDSRFVEKILERN